MFTGIIEELGKVTALDGSAGGARMRIAASIVTKDSSEGDSIAVNGVCLTALEISANGFSADLSRETLDRSTLGDLEVGAPVNLERAVKPSARLGGHIVQGHVDGRGQLLSAAQCGDFWIVEIGFPSDLARYFVQKGSVAVEGISLTIADLGNDHFKIAIIPKTWELTNLSALQPGDAVNLEVDVIAKYVERIIQLESPST